VAPCSGRGQRAGPSLLAALAVSADKQCCWQGGCFCVGAARVLLGPAVVQGVVCMPCRAVCTHSYYRLPAFSCVWMTSPAARSALTPIVSITLMNRLLGGARSQQIEQTLVCGGARL
jgi:hypothetical protein